MKKIILFFILCHSINAFINIESLRENSKEGFNKSARVSFNQQTGNTDKILAGISTLNSYLTKRNEFLFIGNYRYGESFDEKDTELGNAHLRFKRKIHRRHHVETYTQFQFDKFKALNLRELYGLGYRHEDKYFNTGLGAFFESESLRTGKKEDDIRGNFYISGTKSTEIGLEFSTIIYVQPAFTKSNDVRIILNSGVSQRVTSFLNINIEYEYTYDQDPPTNIKQYDSSLMFGFSLI